jgi:hypothetical protein
MLWFPVAASRVLPGWMFNVALFVHGAEASLAIGFIFVVHFFNGHLRPGKFPMDLVIFTGSVTRGARTSGAGEYDGCRSGARTLVAWRRRRPARRGRIEADRLDVGLALVALILYALRVTSRSRAAERQRELCA